MYRETYKIQDFYQDAKVEQEKIITYYSNEMFDLNMSTLHSFMSSFFTVHNEDYKLISKDNSTIISINVDGEIKYLKENKGNCKYKEYFKINYTEFAKHCRAFRVHLETGIRMDNKYK